MSSPNYVMTSCYLPLGVATAGTADTLYMCPPQDGGTWTLERLTLCVHLAITAHATNYATITTTKAGGAIGADSTTAGGTGSIAVTAPQALTVGGVVRDFASTETLVIAITKPGAGVALEGQIYAEWVKHA